MAVILFEFICLQSAQSSLAHISEMRQIVSASAESVSSYPGRKISVRRRAAVSVSTLLLAEVIATCLMVRAHGASSLLFDVEAGQTKCVGEVMSKHEVAKGGFSVASGGSAVAGGAAQSGELEVTVTGPAGEREYTSTGASAGKFAFTASEAGAHRVCATNTATGGVKRVAIEWAAGVDARDYAEVAKKEHLLPIEVRRSRW